METQEDSTFQRGLLLDLLGLESLKPRWPLLFGLQFLGTLGDKNKTKQTKKPGSRPCHCPGKVELWRPPGEVGTPPAVVVPLWDPGDLYV